MDTPVIEPRWPERECFHRSVTFSLSAYMDLRAGRVERIPIVCLDCGFSSGQL